MEETFAYNGKELGKKKKEEEKEKIAKEKEREITQKLGFDFILKCVNQV